MILNCRACFMAKTRYEWHMDDIRVHTSGIRMTWHTNDIEWDTDNMWFERKKIIFFKSFFQNIWFVKEFLYCNGCFGLFDKIKKGPGTNFCCTFSAWFFHTNTSCLILYQLTNFQCDIYFTGIKQKILSSSYLDNWWRHKL